jgi:hypothetical protein
MVRLGFVPNNETWSVVESGVTLTLMSVRFASLAALPVCRMSLCLDLASWMDQTGFFLFHPHQSKKPVCMGIKGSTVWRLVVTTLSGSATAVTEPAPLRLHRLVVGIWPSRPCIFSSVIVFQPFVMTTPRNMPMPVGGCCMLQNVALHNPNL